MPFSVALPLCFSPAATAPVPVPDGVSSCGSTNMRHADHLPPLPCIGEPTAASHVSSGSSPTRFEASRSAPCYAANAEPDSKPQVEASVGRSTHMVLAMVAMGRRGKHYGCHPAPSDGSCAESLSKHRPASPSPICSPVSSHSGDDSGSGDDRESYDGDDTSSFVTPRMVNLRILQCSKWRKNSKRGCQPEKIS